MFSEESRVCVVGLHSISEPYTDVSENGQGRENTENVFINDRCIRYRRFLELKWSFDSEMNGEQSRDAL